jgi:hypothetical protein
VSVRLLWVVLKTSWDFQGRRSGGRSLRQELPVNRPHKGPFFIGDLLQATCHLVSPYSIQSPYLVWIGTGYTMPRKASLVASR